MELNGTITAGGALYGAFGTDSGNYNDLRNKPSINGVELVGNKTSEDLLIDPGGTTDYEDLENKPQINYTPLEGNLTLDDLDIQSKIDFPEDSLRFLDGAGQFRIPDYFSGDYDDLANRPEIAGITLTGDKSLTDLGIQAEIDFPGDNTLYLNGNGNFTQPNYFSGDYDDLTDKPQINSVTLEGNKTASDLKLVSEIHTASGAEAAIETDDTLPLLSCLSDINLVQDLHGYSKPWAGGANYNKWDEDWELGYIDSQGNNTTSSVNIRSKNYIPIEPNTTYYLKSGYTTVVYCPIFYYDANKVFLSANLQQVWNTVITTPPNASYIRFYMNSAYGNVYNNDIAINYPSTITDYSPYANICPISGHTDVTVTVASTSGGSGDDTTVSLGRTVYGGLLDVTTGVLTVTHAIVNVGSLSWTRTTDYNNPIFYAQITDKMNSSIDSICEWYANGGLITGPTTINALQNGYFGCGNNSKYIYVRDDQYTSVSDFTSATASVKFLYELATPQTFNLTKAQVLTLLGQNYVSHDGGGNIKVVYIRDLDIVINDLINRVTALENE